MEGAMSITTKDIKVLIPDTIQNKLDNKNYKISGTQVRDKKGRIVCNLESLNTTENRYFSRDIFQRFENCTFISGSAVSLELQKKLNQVRSNVQALDSKLNTILSRQTNDLISSISEFEEHFNSLMEGSSLTSETITFQSGVSAASRLASHIKSYLDDYINSTIVHHNNTSYNGEKYSKYLEREFKPTISKRQFFRFMEHSGNYFSYSFLNILNNLNILSICHDKKLYPRYETNLKALELMLKETLNFLIKSYGEDEDIYTSSYSRRGYNNECIQIDLERILKYDNSVNIHTLLLRDYPKGVHSEYDELRLNSIYDIIDILEEIENLKLRAKQVENLNLEDLTEPEEIKNLIFNNKKSASTNIDR